GIWAWNVFELTVKPGLETKFPINTDVHWAKVPETDVCQARFEVTVKNDGQSPFDITDVRTSGWIVDLEKERLLATKDDAPLYFDSARLKERDDVPSCQKDGQKPQTLSAPAQSVPKEEASPPAQIEPFKTGNDKSLCKDLVDHFPPGKESSSTSQF